MNISLRLERSFGTNMWEKRDSIILAERVELLKEANKLLIAEDKRGHGGGAAKGTVFPRCFCTHSRMKHWGTRINSINVSGRIVHEFIYAGCRALEFKCQEFKEVE
jgi:hypothetical protein